MWWKTSIAFSQHIKKGTKHKGCKEMDYTFPEYIQRAQRHEKSSDTHPKPVRKSRHRQRHHEDRCNVRHQHNETLGGEQIKKEPHDPRPEADSRGAEIGEPVRNDGEDDTDEEEVWEAD